MKNLQILYSAVPIMVMMGFFTKHSNPPDTALTQLDGNWIRKEYLVDENNDGIFTNEALPCESGDVWKFLPDNTFEMRDEMPYCDEDVDTLNIVPGRWELRNNNTELFMEVDSVFGQYHFQIQFISESKMELRLYNPSGGHWYEEERFTFLKQ